MHQSTMNRSHWAKLTIFLLLLSIFLIVGAIVFIDPFEIYHQSINHIPPISNTTQNYSNAGIAKSYEYNSIIIGSSMTENFRPSQFDELFGGQFVKLPINAGSPFNHRQMMEIAFRTHDIHRVVYCVDITALTYFYTQPKTEMPTYLYDTELFNDVYYWFNKDVLSTYLLRALSTWGQTDPNIRDTMYTWGNLYPYGREYALAGLGDPQPGISQEVPPEDNALAQQSLLNWQYNYKPFIEEHPDTEFIFFYPPYCIARWYQFYESGQLEYHLSQIAALTRELLQYDNVSVFDFRACTDWIMNFDNYIDSFHYGPWINDEIAIQISLGEHQITDLQQILSNSNIIRNLLNEITESGKWPE